MLGVRFFDFSIEFRLLAVVKLATKFLLGLNIANIGKIKINSEQDHN